MVEADVELDEWEVLGSDVFQGSVSEVVVVWVGGCVHRMSLWREGMF